LRYSGGLRCHQSADWRYWRIKDIWPAERGDRSDDPRAGRNLAHYADVIKADLHVDVKQVAGAGAAGGMGAALMAFLNAELRSGIEIVTQALNLEEHILDCSLVVTGEGRLDSQSINGKVPVGVANVAKKYHKPVIGIAGSLTRMSAWFTSMVLMRCSAC
jgi:glycerate kinase